MNLADLLGKTVIVEQHIDTGHHQHCIASRGKLVGIEAHMVAIEVDNVVDDEQDIDFVAGLCWFNTRASTFSAITPV